MDTSRAKQAIFERIRKAQGRPDQVTEEERAAVRDYLARHPLKRNTRELKEICLKALLTSEGDEITLPGLEPDPEVAPAETPVDEKGRGTTKSISKDELLMALQHCGNNKTQAAKLLGLGRTAMYDLMARHGVKRGNDSTA